MDIKKIDFPKTDEAIAALSGEIAKFAGDLKLKKEFLKKQHSQNEDVLSAKENSLKKLQQTATCTINNLDVIISQLDKVLEKDGTRNNNN